MQEEKNIEQPIRETLLPYGQQWLDDSDIQAVVDVLKGDFITQGPAIRQFEDNIAKYVDAKYAVAFTNGTAALHGACFAADFGPNDEVITTPLTFLASSNCILYQGATPVFADIDPKTYNIDPEKIKNALTSKTRGIIAVDFTGQPVEVDTISAIAAEQNLVFIQDAAHSLGAEYNGKKVGHNADMTMFSFHPVKHVTTGEGGIIVTNNESYYRKLLHFRNHGMTKEPEELINNEGAWYYEMQSLGYNYRMTDMQAALGISQFKKIDEFVSRRRDIVQKYNTAFADLFGIITPYQHPNSNSSWHLYVTQWSLECFNAERKEIFEELRRLNIGVHVHYIPVYLQPYYQKLGYPKKLAPIAEKYYQQAITLPLFPKMTDSDVQDVISAVKKVHAKWIKKNL